MYRPSKPARLIVALLLLSLCSASLLVDNTSAKTRRAQELVETADKVSPDLRALIQSGNGSSRVKVLVQTSSDPNLLSNLLNLVTNLGGTVLKTLTRLNVLLVDIPANAVDVLATESGVLYISGDLRFHGPAALRR